MNVALFLVYLLMINITISIDTSILTIHFLRRSVESEYLHVNAEDFLPVTLFSPIKKKSSSAEIYFIEDPDVFKKSTAMDLCYKIPIEISLSIHLPHFFFLNHIRDIHFYEAFFIVAMWMSIKSKNLVRIDSWKIFPQRVPILWHHH